MTRSAPAPMLFAAPRPPSQGSALTLHARMRVKPKSFVDFCEVPQLGDTNAQDMLWLDGRALLRGSPRRVRQVAMKLAERLRSEEARGREACPVLQHQHVRVPALGRAIVHFTVAQAGELFLAQTFDDLTVCRVLAHGREHTLHALPCLISAGAEVSVVLENPHDVDLHGELLLGLDERPEDGSVR